MLNSKSILAIIPARGGSKGIPRKNIRLLAGKPLISYTIKTALSSNYIDDVVLTTDDEEIATISSLYGIKHIINRPKELAEDMVTLTPVIIHAVKEFEKKKQKKYDIIITLQPTSPTLNVQSLDKAIETFVENSKINTIISSKEVRHLFWEKKYEKFHLYQKERLNRQQLQPVFFETGGFVISNRENLEEGLRIKEPIQLFPLSEKETIDIDTVEDWITAESLLKRKKIFFRVEGNHELGLGHIYRVLTLANALIEHDLLFIISEKSDLGIKKISNYNYNVKVIKEETEFIDLIKKQRPNIVILDILDTTDILLKKLLQLNVFIVTFEDMGAGYQYADLVFNALYSKENNSRENVFTGYDYICLREEFFIFPEKEITREVNKILITFGGTDQNNLSMRALKVLERLNRKDIQIVIILGYGYKNFDVISAEVKRLQGKNFNIELKQDIKFMAKYIYESDLVITSNGRTIFEVASIGVPCISISQNVRETKHTFALKSKGIYYLGLATEKTEMELEMALNELIEDYDRRLKMNIELRRYNMKKGIKRVINIIFEKYEDKYRENILNIQ